MEISAHGRRSSSARIASSRVLRRRSRAATAYGTGAGMVTTTRLGDLRRLEVNLVAYAAVGARPVVGHLAPRRARREALARVALALVVRVAALGAGVGAHAATACRRPP